MRAVLFIPAILLMSAGCGQNQNQTAQQASTPLPVEPHPVAPPPADDRPVILCFGDSLTAGYGVEPGKNYPDLMQAALDARGYHYRVVNAGISGDTTSGGVARLAEAVASKPEVVLLELGGNDGLRGLPINVTRANLDEMIRGFQSTGAKVVLAGMTLPRNYGPEYIGQFEKVYRDLAKEHKLTLIPFPLEPLVSKPGMMQNDGIHPTASGYREVVPSFVQLLEPQLKK
ncbi:MAG: arylesterase [Acidobacteriota bacterium]